MKINRTLEQLIELQKIDTRLNEIDELKGDLPEKVKKLTGKVSALTAENEENQIRIEEIEKEIRILSTVIEERTDQLKKYKEQLYLVTSNKEYDALLKELDVVKNDIGESETALLKFDEEKSTLNELIKSNDLNLETIKADLGKSSKTLKTALKETDAEEKDLIQQREKFVVDIDARSLKEYDRFRIARDGNGIIELTRGACGSCYYSLPPQIVIEIKRRNKMLKCPSCGIYLFYDFDD